MELTFIFIYSPFPCRQAPLNYEWNISKSIYNVPCNASVNSTWQFSDEVKIWPGMSQCACYGFIERDWLWSLRRLAFLPCWLRWTALEIKWETGFQGLLYPHLATLTSIFWRLKPTGEHSSFSHYNSLSITVKLIISNWRYS